MFSVCRINSTLRLTGVAAGNDLAALGPVFRILGQIGNRGLAGGYLRKSGGGVRVRLGAVRRGDSL
jgi:hypothetical protein